MMKTWHVAWREFICTVLTRGFIIGILLPPVIMTGALALMPVLMNAAPPKTSGRVAVIDQSGKAIDYLKAEFTPEKLAETRRRKAEQVKKQAQKFTPPGADGAMGVAMAAAETEATLALEMLAAETNVKEAKDAIPTVRSRKDLAANARLALIVIPDAAVAAPTASTPDQPAKYGPFELYTTPTLDPEVKDQLERATKRAIVNTRLASTGLDVARVRGLFSDPETMSKTVTEGGERSTNDAAAMLVPGAFLFLLWISVFTAGQYLLTTTIEEKSNRVMEVLLSAASPIQLMVGKILGQMAVGGVIMGLYAGTGVLALTYFALNHLIDPMKILYLGVYFMIAFFLIACIMAAVGSAVSDIREAQSLMGPVMIVLVIPMILWFPILRNPNSTFATVCSFLPPISPFIMVLRLAGSEPVPLWQIPVSIGLGAFYVVAAAWGAAKIFRIGVLMYGKPPNLATLIKWIRMA